MRWNPLKFDAESSLPHMSLQDWLLFWPWVKWSSILVSVIALFAALPSVRPIGLPFFFVFAVVWIVIIAIRLSRTSRFEIGPTIVDVPTMRRSMLVTALLLLPTLIYANVALVGDVRRNFTLLVGDDAPSVAAYRAFRAQFDAYHELSSLLPKDMELLVSKIGGDEEKFSLGLDSALTRNRLARPLMEKFRSDFDNVAGSELAKVSVVSLASTNFQVDDLIGLLQRAVARTSRHEDVSEFDLWRIYSIYGALQTPFEGVYRSKCAKQVSGYEFCDLIPDIKYFETAANLASLGTFSWRWSNSEIEADARTAASRSGGLLSLGDATNLGFFRIGQPLDRTHHHSYGLAGWHGLIWLLLFLIVIAAFFRGLRLQSETPVSISALVILFGLLMLLLNDLGLDIIAFDVSISDNAEDLGVYFAIPIVFFIIAFGFVNRYWGGSFTNNTVRCLGFLLSAIAWLSCLALIAETGPIGLLGCVVMVAAVYLFTIWQDHLILRRNARPASQ